MSSKPIHAVAYIRTSFLSKSCKKHVSNHLEDGVAYYYIIAKPVLSSTAINAQKNKNLSNKAPKDSFVIKLCSGSIWTT